MVQMKSVDSLSGGRSSSYMALHYPTDISLFALVRIEDPRCSPDDKKLIQMVSDKIGCEFIATAEDDLTLKVMFDLEQMLGREIKWLTGVTYDHLLTQKGFFGGGANGRGRLPSWARRYCTSELKLLPIFEYCFKYIFKSESDKVLMRIGYRSDEAHRKEKFSSFFHYPIACKNYGQKRKIKKTFDWRIGHFPMIDDNINQFEVHHYWKNKPLQFPIQSNCIGCFHKDEMSINLQWKNNPNKMRWFANQELLGKGTWRDNNITYEQIRKWNFSESFDFSQAGACDSGGCTD